GLVVEEEDQTGDWKRIKLPDGNTGWVPSKSLEEI
ncbi:MAG: SH3-like domain-containing protein, partial [Oceanospirillaceae bacterium]